ncbi:MAG: ROK family protein [Gemmataceae bacterium]
MTPARSQVRPSLLRQLHSRQVLTTLQQQGPMSRAEIARHTGISGPTVTRAVSDLLAAGLLEEGDALPAAAGRPGKIIRLASLRVGVLGVVVGVRGCELVAAGLDGQIQPDSVRTFPTPPRYADLVAAIAAHAQPFLNNGGATILGMGVSMPGLLNRRHERTVFSPNLHQADGQCLGVDLRERLGLDVAMIQESHALCLAEQTYGAARGVADFAMLDLTDGLGLGVVLGGRQMEGHSGLAGELGHITVELNGRPCGCGNRGCLETVATDSALATALSERLGHTLTIDDIVTAVRAGRLRADEEFERLLQYLAVGLAAVVNIFNPSKLFLYARFLDAAPDLWDRLMTLTHQRALAPSLADCAIIRARGNKQLGAIACIIHRFTTDRTDFTRGER